MKFLFRILPLLLSVSLPIGPSLADTMPTVADLDFMNGAWKMDANPELTEVWLDDAGGVKQGMFRNMKNGKYYMGELLLIEDTDQGSMFRFDWYKADFSTFRPSGSPPIVLRLTDSGIDSATFRNIDQNQQAPQHVVYIRTGPDQMEVRLRPLDKNGNPDESKLTVFKYQRTTIN